MTSDPTSQAAAASGVPPVASEARPADRLDDLGWQVDHEGYVEGLDAIRLVGIAKAYRDGDDRLALAYLQRLLGEDAEPDDDDESWAERVADTTRRAQ